MAKAGVKDAPAVRRGTEATNWQERMAKHVAQAVEQEESVVSGAFINTRAGQLTYQGNPFKDNKFDAIIIDGILENCYYPDKFDPDTPTPPVCYAFGRNDKEMAPHDKSTEKQSPLCADCQWNEFGSAEQGKGKACKNQRRLALIPADKLDAATLGRVEAAFLKVPVTSVKGWAAYVRTLSALYKVAPLGVVTTVSARPDPKTQFRITFEMKEVLPDELMPVAFARAEEIAEQISFPYQEAQAQDKAPAKNQNRKRKY